MNADEVRLTAREMDVFLGMARGESLQETGTRLRISVSRAKNVRSSIYSKLKVNSSGEAVREGMRLGILTRKHFE